MTDSPEIREEMAGPPVVPGSGEKPVADGAAFSAECLESLRTTVPLSSSWKLGKQLVTHSEEWGDIWRADFEVEKSLAPMINRVVLWRQANSSLPMIVAIGQQIAPL